MKIIDPVIYKVAKKYCLEVVTFEELIKRYYETGGDIDFIYDSISHLVLLNIHLGVNATHQSVMSDLYIERSGKRKGTTYDNADEFIFKDYGMFKSSVSGDITCSKTFTLPSEFPLRLRVYINRIDK